MRTPLRLLWGLPALLAIALGVVAVTAWLPVPPLPQPGPRPAPPGAPAPVPAPAPAPPPGTTPGTAPSGEPSAGGAGESSSGVGTPGPGSAPDGAPGAAVADAPPAAPEGGPLSALAPVRVPRPAVPPGPRRIGIQAGHWLTAEVPEELRRLEHSTGTAGGGVLEVQVNLDVANRVAAILRARGYHVDVLPTTVPPHYLADVFLALHADGSPDPGARGFKAAHGSRRGPYEGQLVQAVTEEYRRVTGLPTDPIISRNMRGYYAFSWSRLQSAVAPHTPAAILEMGFMTNAADRALLVGRPDLVAEAVANGLQRFLDEVPAGAAFAEDLILPPLPPRATPTPTPAPR
jgi:hypothetical protein